MDIGIISARYAKALLKYAASQGDLDGVYAGMSLLSESFVKVPQLRVALENPVVNDERKLQILTTASGGELSASLSQFFRLVLKNRRVAFVQFMAHAFVDAYRKEKRLVHSRLTVPVELNETTLERLKQLVKAKTDQDVEFVVNVDPSIIGGFVMEYDTYSYDASIRTQLGRIHRQLTMNR